jgi:hypothetical protein
MDAMKSTTHRYEFVNEIQAKWCTNENGGQQVAISFDDGDERVELVVLPGTAERLAERIGRALAEVTSNPLLTV